jgi:hypothetical protein
MPNKAKDEKEETLNLLRKMLVFQLNPMGVHQDKIAKIVGKQKAWVNDLLKCIPKGGKNDGGKRKAKKGKAKKGKGRTNR